MLANKIENVKNEKELNSILHKAIDTLDVKIPWGNAKNFDNYMGGKK